MLKEKAAIDTLLNKAVNPNAEPGKFINKQVMKDKCLLIDIQNLNDGSKLFVVQVIHKKLINIYINAAEQHKSEFGYFPYNGFKAFIISYMSNKISAEFFSKMPLNKSFNFIYRTGTRKIRMGKLCLVIL